MEWIKILYLIPLCLSIIYFTLIKIEDVIYENGIYSKNKFNYWQVICICFVPILNIVIVILAVKKQFE